MVVLTLLVATFIPINPARPEHPAPIINDNDTSQLVPSLTPLIARRTEVRITKIDKILYSALKKPLLHQQYFLRF